MALYSLLSRVWTRASDQQLVDRIATSCATEILPRINSSVRQWSAAERLGYLRARTTPIVHRETQRHAGHLPKARYQKVVTHVHDQVVVLLNQFIHQPQTVALRRAA